MARPRRPGRNKVVRSFRQLRRFHHVINTDMVFGTHKRQPKFREVFSGKRPASYRLSRFFAVIIHKFDVSDFKAYVMIEWIKQRDLLIDEALAFAQAVAANTPKMALTPVHQPDAAQGFVSSAQRPVAVTESAPRDTPDMERNAILRRVANFKAHQERFQREREDYFQKTMAKAQSDKWIPQSRDKL
jgi:hypothetical protein